MPYGEAVPNPWVGYQYSVEVARDDSVGSIACVLKADNPDYESQYDGLVQAFVDLVAGAPHFVVAGMSKSFITAQPITPTPPAEPE